MERILGLDLGTNSIGWAIREINSEIENQIIDKGVLTFDKGVAEDKSGEHPMVQKRTEARGKRRNYQAEKYRKWELLECLILEGMCPLTIEELNEWRHYTKGVGRRYPQSEKFIQWLRFDFDGDGKPDFERFGFSKHESYYLFRSLIIDESKIDIFKREPHIIGRVLYQLVQRRGYNDGQNIDENEKDELSKTIKKGGGESGAVGADEIEPFIAKYKTLGAALYEVQKQNGVRIRKRYNLRSQLDKELQTICNIQSLEHLYKALWGAIIWQRPLRSQKGLVGVCTFEQNKRRCPISHPLYEEYRTWVFINNLKIKPIIKNDISINKLELYDALNQIVYPQFFKAANDFKLSSIVKELEKVGFEITAKFPNDTKVISFSFLYKMKEMFGDDWTSILEWQELIYDEPKKHSYNIEDLWHLHFTKTTNKKTGEEPFDFLKRFVIEKLKLTDDKAEVFAKIRLQQGYATLSLSAIKKILPYLQKGFIYSEAVYLANLHKVLGLKNLTDEDTNNYAKFIREIITNFKYEQKKVAIVNSLIAIYFEDKKIFETNKNETITKIISENFGDYYWNALPTQKALNILNDITDEINLFLSKPKWKAENHFIKAGRLHERIFVALMNETGISVNNIKYLWHPSEQESYVPAIATDGKYYLGSPEPISKGFKNPMALKTMHKLKKLINYLIKVGKIEPDTRIVIEIARELNDANKRRAIERWQRDREKENDVYKKQIVEINNECKTNFNEQDKNLIDKIRLSEEQKRQCIYTGKTIGLKEILDGSKYDFEHSIPASMSFDNELKNLTIADKTYNQQIKGKKLPSECPNYKSDYTLNGVIYPAILNTMQIVFGKMKEVEKKIKGKSITIRSFEKIEYLENQLEEWRAKKSDDKGIKDNIIQRRHLIKMELDYWRKKLQSFTITEYKAGWRNSQLKDTQTITKYALPYLKTVFNKVEVQKGNITSDFRKIYKIQPRFEKKERTKHSHHAIDAAVLTLIPSAAIRDKILLNYNEANEKNQGYHEKPRQWNNFETKYILGIEDDVLINYQAQHRTLTPTYKTVRKRGEVQYVKEKLANGEWQYKTDEDGNKIPLLSKGDSIRGQLHKDSFFGAIKNKGELSLVERYPISTFTSINDCKHIVDAKVKELVQNELQKRMDEGLSFDKAKLEPIPFHKGNEVIKKVRCKVAAGRGYLTPEKALAIHQHNSVSKQEYKNVIYAQNNENTFCLYYELEVNNKIERAFRIVGLFELAKLGLKNESDLFNDNYYKSMEGGKGKNKINLPLHTILKVGTKVIFYKETIDELKEISKDLLLKRVFRIYKFNEPAPATVYVYLQNHIEARTNDDLGGGEKDLSLDIYQSRIFLGASKFKTAIEGKDFEIKPDGEIEWKS
ncbi:MAG: type II CRISPR RNA-guided endonuclease Cas9 [Bacteroidia bacterium]